MNGALFVISINTTLALVMAAGFFAIARFDRYNAAARWMVLAFVLGAVSVAAEFLVSASIASDLSRMVVALAFLAALLCFVVALSRFYRTAQDWTSLGAIFAAATLLYALTLDMPRNDPLRQFLYQLPYALICLLALSHVWRARQRRAIDWALMGLLVVSALVFVGKSMIANMIGGVGVTADAYSGTLYAMISQSSGAILVLIVGKLIMFMLARQSVARLIRQSERDTDTGLLNRAGFFNHGDAVLRPSKGHTAHSVALIVFTLDGKVPGGTPDTHARAVAGVLHALDTTAARAGRLGPARFAILLPHTNLLAARQSAETLRKQIAGTADITASFGITEKEPADALSDMLSRADWALEEARRAGGDCVRLSARAALGLARPRAIS